MRTPWDVEAEIAEDEDAFDRLLSIILVLLVIGMCSFGLGLLYTLISGVLG